MKDEFFAEKWLPMVGWESTHECSDCGRVKSLPREQHGINKSGTHFTRWLRGRILKTAANNAGYHFFTPMIDTELKLIIVHRVVALTWCKNPDEKLRVMHVDGDKNNNRADNLRWATMADILQNAARLGKIKLRDNAQRINFEDAVAIRERYGNGETQVALAKEYGVSQGHISNIIHDRTWKKNTRLLDKHGNLEYLTPVGKASKKKA